MTGERLRELRRAVRAGELPDDLVDFLQAVAQRLVRVRVLPPAYAPYGRWDAEAADEVFQSWYERRLLGQGHLQLLLDRAENPVALERLAERSLRQHLARERDRSQARNLYTRLVRLLEESFEPAAEAARRQDRFWRPQGSAFMPWAGDDDRLFAHAWALGDFTIIRYRAAARKQSPLLDASELERFVRGLMERSQAALSPALVIRALVARFALADVETASLDELTEAGRAEASDESVEGEVELADTARAVLAELSARQAEVLSRTIADEPVERIASALNCSVGTVVNERRRIGAVVVRLSADDDERATLLNTVADLVYQVDDG